MNKANQGGPAGDKANERNETQDIVGELLPLTPSGGTRSDSCTRELRVCEVRKSTRQRYLGSEIELGGMTVVHTCPHHPCALG